MSQSTDHGVTWSNPVAAMTLNGTSADSCVITDGGVYFDTDADVWHALYQCMGKSGGWNLCHYTRQGSDPLGPFVPDSHAPSVTGGQLWGQICSGSGKACPASMRDEGTAQIIKKENGFYYVTFHGANYGTTVTGARGVARTSDFITWQVAGADLPDNAMLSSKDCNPWSVNWIAGGCIGAGDASLIRSGGYNYMVAEAADISLGCTVGQNWVFGLMRSSSFATSGNWESYGSNAFVTDATASPFGCALQYMNLIRDRGEMFLHFLFYASDGTSPNQTYQLSGGPGPTKISTQWVQGSNWRQKGASLYLAHFAVGLEKIRKQTVLKEFNTYQGEIYV